MDASSMIPGSRRAATEDHAESGRTRKTPAKRPLYVDDRTRKRAGRSERRLRKQRMTAGQTRVDVRRPRSLTHRFRFAMRRRRDAKALFA
jgi:hypothetical protein